MKLSMFKFGVVLPLVATATIGWSDSAKAVTFNLGDQININGTLRLNKFFPTIPGSVIDVLFAPDLPAGGAAPIGQTALGNIDSTGNTGVFSIFNSPSPLVRDAQAEVRSFNVLCGIAGGSCDVSGFDNNINPVNNDHPDNFFVLADSSFAYPGGGAFPTKYAFSLDVNTVSANFNLLATGYAIDFSAAGQVYDLGLDGLFGTADDGETAGVKYDFTAQGLKPNNRGITNFSTYSGSIIVDEVATVPEPSTNAGLVALGGLAAIGGLFNRKQSIKI